MHTYAYTCTCGHTHTHRHTQTHTRTHARTHSQKACVRVGNDERGGKGRNGWVTVGTAGVWGHTSGTAAHARSQARPSACLCPGMARHTGWSSTGGPAARPHPPASPCASARVHVCVCMCVCACVCVCVCVCVCKGMHTQPEWEYARLNTCTSWSTHECACTLACTPWSTHMYGSP